jgi:hypothetical protein
MITKLFIIFIMIIIAGSLASGLFFLVRDAGNSKRTVKALTIRITISLTLFIFLLVAFKFGLIKPHGL